MLFDEPLDFELDDPLLRDPPPPPAATSNKRRKVIGLDDLLTDHYTEESKFMENAAADCSKRKRNCTSDDDDDDDKVPSNKENEISKFVESCQKEVNDIATGEDMPLWGLQVFGRQKPRPVFDSSVLKSCKILQFSQEERSMFCDDADAEGYSFLEDMLKNRWLLHLVSASGCLEDSVASWAFDKMMYSSDEKLHSSACDFLCSVLLSRNISIPASKSDYYSYSAIKHALDTYGYLFGQLNCSSTKLTHQNRLDEVCCPSSNIKSWVKFVSALCKLRGSRALLSTTEAEELLSIILSLLLDRRLQGLLFLLDECLRSVVGFFSEEEWHDSCKNVTISVARRIPSDLNCLRIIECIPASNSRGKNLRSALAFQVLIHLFDEQAIDGKDIVKFFLSINLKDKTCDFFKLYVYLVLFENWLRFDTQVEEKQKILKLWSKFIRNCSIQIASTDWRSYASKVRNKASYLMQTEI